MLHLGHGVVRGSDNFAFLYRVEQPAELLCRRRMHIDNLLKGFASTGRFQDLCPYFGRDIGAKQEICGMTSPATMDELDHEHEEIRGGKSGREGT